MQPLPNLEHFDFIKSISEKSKKMLLQGLQFATFEKGTLVLQKGEPISGAFLILNGKLRVYSLSEAGKEGTLYTLQPGSTCVFALTCVFNEILYPAWVEAEEKSSVAIVPGKIFRELFRNEPSVHQFLFNALASLVFDLTTNLDRMMIGNIKTRLASFLLTCSSQDGTVQMSHETIANQLGTAREVVSRQLKSFRENGWVSTRRGTITVISPDEISTYLSDL